MQLRTVFRWAVTGTPIQRHGLRDLFGLFAFLGRAPWAERHWWRAALERPYASGVEALQAMCVADGCARVTRRQLVCTMCTDTLVHDWRRRSARSPPTHMGALPNARPDLRRCEREVSRILWRSNKEDAAVAAELSVPPQTEAALPVLFGAVER